MTKEELIKSITDKLNLKIINDYLEGIIFFLRDKVSNHNFNYIIKKYGISPYEIAIISSKLKQRKFLATLNSFLDDKITYDNLPNFLKKAFNGNQLSKIKNLINADRASFNKLTLVIDEEISFNKFKKNFKNHDSIMSEFVNEVCNFFENVYNSEYTRIKQIGKSYEKENKTCEKHSYEHNIPCIKRNPETKEAEKDSTHYLYILRKLLKEKNENFNSLFTLTTAEELYKIYFIIDFVNLQLGTDYEMFIVYWHDDLFKNVEFKTINIKMIKDMLSKCSVEDLTDLLYSLETGNYGNYINEPEYDPYDSFIDDTDINTLYFVYENIDVIEKNIDILSLFFDKVMQRHSDEEIEILNIELRKRKSVRHNDKNIRELINIRYTHNTIMDNEYDFRCHIFHNNFSRVDDFTSDRVIYIFRNMTSDKWDFIVQAFDKFAKPAGKIAIDYFNKIIQ